MKRGITKSCGCLKSETTVQKNKRGFKGRGELSGTYFSQIRYQAKKRNLEFSITVDDLWDLFLAQKGKCAISGMDIFLTPGTKRGHPTSASLDRINSTKGYALNNVQWVHKHINIMKNSQSMEEFLYICKKIAAFQAKKT